MDIMTAYNVAIGVLGGLWICSEALAQIPSIKANSVFQAIYNGLKGLNAKFGK